MTKKKSEKTHKKKRKEKKMRSHGCVWQFYVLCTYYVCNTEQKDIYIMWILYNCTHWRIEDRGGGAIAIVAIIPKWGDYMYFSKNKTIYVENHRFTYFTSVGFYILLSPPSKKES